MKKPFYVYPFEFISNSDALALFVKLFIRILLACSDIKLKELTVKISHLEFSESAF